MASTYRYDDRVPVTHRLSRRRFVGGAATLGIAAAAAGLVGCSSTNNKNNVARPAASATASAPGTVASAASAAATRAGTPASAASAVAGRTGTPAALDSTKGKPGGTLKYMYSGFPASFIITEQRAPYSFAAFTHCGLLAMHWGTQGVAYDDYTLEPDLSQAMPEQTDPLTFVHKLMPAKFSNGRAVTSQDVKYTYDRYATDPKAVYGPDFQAWYDHIETPDPQTVVIKAKIPYADALEAMSANFYGFIMAKEYEESPDVTARPMGAGPYTVSDIQPPVTMTFKKNPDYFRKPYPYFDQIQLTFATDPVVRITNFTTHQVHMPWVNYAQDRDQIKKARPDAKFVTVDPYLGHAVYSRTDKPPFNDKRVRQALSMAIDREALKKVTNDGEGENDQFFSVMFQKKSGASKVADLGPAAKYWTLDLQTAKQLLAAAGVTLPIETQMSHYDATLIGQAYVDAATFVEAGWKQAGVLNAKDIAQTPAQFGATTSLGQYEGMGFSVVPGPMSGVGYGLQVKNYAYWGPNGEHSGLNSAYINDADLNPLILKQLQQVNAADRKQTFQQMEKIMAEQQYWLELTSNSSTWFWDPSLANVSMAQEQGSRRYAMKWWFA